MLRIIFFLTLILQNVFSEVPRQVERDSYKIKDKALDTIESYPTWLIIENAKKFRKAGDMNTALVYLMKAQSKDYNNPNVLFELGILYKDLQDYKVALNYFQKTIKQAIRGSKYNESIIKYTTYYEIAEIYYFQKKYKSYEETLLKIMDDEKINPNIKNLLLKQYAFILTGKRSFINKKSKFPLDELVYLYRIKDDFSQKAHKLLGEYYLNNGNYELAMMHSLYIVLKVYTRIIEEIKKDNVNFQFTSTKDLLDYIEKGNKYKLYMKTSGFFDALTNLGLAVFGYEPSNIIEQSSKDIWELVEQYGFYDNKRKASILLSLNNAGIRKYLLKLLKDFNFQ